MQEVLSVDGLTKSFGTVSVFKELTFRLQGPQRIGILGPNGAGKTTLLDILQGLSSPSSGQVRILGQPLQPYPRRRVGVVLQRECSFAAIRVGEYAELFAAIHNLPEGERRILREAGLEQRRHVALDRLSGGEAQRLYIAAATVHDPELLFLDEPTAHLDPASKKAVGQYLKTMGETRTLVMTTHDLREAESLFDHIVLLVHGEVRAQGSTAEFLGQASSLEEAFFERCAVRISRQGDLQ